MRTPTAAIACCLALLAAPALAQTGPSTDTSPASTAAVADVAPPAPRPREAGALVPAPIWLDRNGTLVETHQNTYADPDRMDAGKPFTPMPWGSIAGTVPGMNAGSAAGPMPVGRPANTPARMQAGTIHLRPAPGAVAVAAPGMETGAGSALRPAEATAPK
ncbi:MAG: hypothetical protein ACOYOH_01250 [Paracraurococcus sp.]